MTRIGRQAVFLVPFLLMIAGCGGEDGSNDSHASHSAVPGEATGTASVPAPPPETAGRPAIPPAMPDAVEGLMIAPYFDEAGTQTEMSVGVGDVFDVYICVDHPGYEIATSQWRMIVPEGITVLGETKAFDAALSLGTYKEMYVMTYPCQVGGETTYILKYSCMVTPNFKGGAFETVRSVISENSKFDPFIGFVTCPPRPEQVPAYGGLATLSIK